MYGFRLALALGGGLDAAAGLDRADRNRCLSGSAQDLVDSLPVAAQKLRLAMRGDGRSKDPSTLDTVQKAAAQIEQAAEENSAKVAARKGDVPANPAAALLSKA